MSKHHQYLAISEPRRELDFYPTPKPYINSVLSLLNRDFGIKGYVIDAGAWDGRWGRAAKAINNDITVAAVDVSMPLPNIGAVDKYILGDFLTYIPDCPAEWVIGNPPYKYAEDFILHALNIVKDGGVVAFLLRLAFLESVGRGSGLFQHAPPHTVYVSSRRVPFAPADGKPRSTVAYAQFVWVKGCIGAPLVRWFDWREL